MSNVDRRSVLKGLGALAATPLVSGCKPEPEPDVEVPPLTFEALRERIDTVVVLMMENRSFDHVLGALSLEEGRSDIDGLQPNHSNLLPNGTVIEVFPAEIDCLADPPHGWTSSHRQFAEGENSGFVTEFEARASGLGEHAMGYLDRSWQPVTYALADAGTVCDQWFCSLMTGTWPNRFYSHCGQNGGVRGNDFPEVDFPSLYTRLTEHDRSWGCYFSVLPFMALLTDNGTGQPLEPIAAFFDDAEDGDLPNVTIVEPAYGINDDHPPAHPLSGQIFIRQVLDALIASPQWDRTVFILTYDEHGGFYDHVPPPTAPDDYAADGFDQLGFRVPTVIVGPWVKPGHVSHTVYDHASILAFCEALFEMEPLTARDAAADPMLDVFDPVAVFQGVPHPPPSLPTVEADREVLVRDQCNFLQNGFRSAPPTGQPELEAYADKHLKGTPLDRRDQALETFDDLLERARLSGAWRPSRS